MSNSRRIGIDLLDDVLKNMINASSKIFPVNYEFVQANENPNQYEFVVVVNDCEYKNHIFRWDNGWHFIGANDVYITWDEVKHKPSAFTPTAHNHDTSYAKLSHTHDYASSTHDHDTSYAKLTHVHDYAPTTHNHDANYATKTHVHDYSPSTHNHDTRYASKAQEPIVADLQQRMYNIENGYTEGHRHNNLDVLGALSYDTTLKYNGLEVSMATHNHDGAYYKKAEVESKLSTKLDKSQTLTSSIGTTQPTTDIWYKKL